MKDGVKKILLWSFTPDDWQVCCKVLDDFFAGEAVEIDKMSFVTRPERITTTSIWPW